MRLRLFIQARTILPAWTFALEFWGAISKNVTTSIHIGPFLLSIYAPTMFTVECGHVIVNFYKQKQNKYSRPIHLRLGRVRLNYNNQRQQTARRF